MKKLAVFVLLFAILGAIRPDSARAESPRLVVIVSVDQLCQNYLERFSKNFADEGFFRMVYREGAVYTNAHHQHAFSFTAPGHASISTGADPSKTGIIDNQWYDRDLKKVINCVFDADAEVIGGDGEGVSPKSLLVNTFGDELKLATNGKAKVFSLAIKDRAAVLMAGHSADGAFWYDKSTGNWVTSNHYRDDIPGYLRVLNESHAAARYAGRKWELLHSHEKYLNQRPDDYEHESPLPDIGRVFPHVLPAADDDTLFAKLTITPFGNEYVLDSAKEVIEGENLGGGATSDVICLGLSCTDYIGHGFGPYSLEVEDGVYRTDLQLKAFYDYLAKRMGDRPWVMAVTADHGVTPIPEFAASFTDAKRNPLGNMDQFQSRLEQHLQEKVGPIDGKYLQHVDPSMVYFDHSHDWKKPRELVYRIAANYLQSHPEIPMARSIGQLKTDDPHTELDNMLFRASHKRAGEVLFVLKPYHMQSGAPATHGGPYSFDTHVPMIICGNAVNSRQVIARPVTVTALAPTLSRMLGLPAPPAADRALLTETLEPSKP